MDKKKAVKLATASAVAASAFVAANPNASEAATNVATVVSQAKAQFKKAYYTYSHTVTETGEFPNINDVYVEYNKAKKAYADAVALVKKSGGANKDAYLADLDATYKEYITKRVVTYIDAYNYAVKLDGLRQQLDEAIKAKDLAKAEELYHKISYELKSRTVILDRVYGQSTRDLLRTKFKAEAQKLRDSLIYDITVAMKAREVQDAVKAGNLDKAKAAVDKINECLPKVTDAFKAQLTDEAKKAVDAYEAALTPKVESVSAINAKQLVIKFNKAIDKSTVIESDNTLVDGLLTVNALKKADGTNSAPVSPDAASASLSEDGKTLTVTLQTSEAFDGKYAVAVNKGVKTADGVEVPAYSAILDVKDTVAPEFVSATAEAKTTTRTVTVKFSEPVQSSGVIAYVNGKAATVSRPAGTPVDELVIQTSDDLQAGQSYELSLLNVKDYAGNLIATNPFKTQFTVAANTSAPTVKDVKVTGENKLEVTFDKAVDGNSFTNNARILDVNGQLVTLLNATVESDGKTVELTAASQIPFGPNGTFTGTLLIGSDVTDTLGNKLGTTYSKSVTFTKDTVAPTVTKVEYSNGKLVVTFSENITNKATDLTGSSVINDSTGAVTQLSSITFGTTAGTNARIVNNNQLEIPVSLSAGNYTLRLAKGTVQDLAGTPNENAASINSFVVNTTATNDTTAPTFTLVSGLVDVDVTGLNTGAAPDDEQTISYTVQDASGLDLASVRDVNNYTLDGKPLPAGTYITTSYNGTDSAPLTVTLHLPSDKITESKTTYQLVISNIKDKAGNYAAPQVSEQFELNEGVKPVLTSATISNGDATTLVLGFTEAVQNVSADDFEFKVNGADITGAATLTSVTSGTDKGKYYVTFATVKDSNGKLYADVDKSGNVSTGDVAIATTADAAGSLDLNKSYVSTLTVKVADSADITDIQGNAVVKGTTITVK
jgi:trimeric autotransporter adhesin